MNYDQAVIFLGLQFMREHVTVFLTIYYEFMQACDRFFNDILWA